MYAYIYIYVCVFRYIDILVDKYKGLHAAPQNIPSQVSSSCFASSMHVPKPSRMQASSAQETRDWAQSYEGYSEPLILNP